MPRYKLALLGFGNVGQALAELLLRKEVELRERCGLDFMVTGIATGSHGTALDPAGLDLSAALETIRSNRSLNELGKCSVKDNLEFIQLSGADVLFENTPVDHASGEPASTHLRTALQAGMHAITANKGPVVHAYRQLTDLAKRSGRKFYFESAVMDGAPLFSLFRHCLPAALLLSFRGVLNSTTNIILTRMEQGESFSQAVAYCQRIGLAERDPSADVDGWDAAIKTAALITVLMDVPFTPAQVDRTGIRDITGRMIRAASAANTRYKLVCSAQRTSSGITARVAPELVTRDSPLFDITGSSSLVEFQTDVLGSLTLIEKDPGVATTAYGLLADLINAVRA